MSRSWKDGLLSSGVILEHAAAQILFQQGFLISGEYPYSRLSPRSDEDFSVDIYATNLLSIETPSGIKKAQLTVLCECKYRSPEKQWIFLPELVEDFSLIPITSLRDLKHFSAYSYDDSARTQFGASFPLCLKGTELSNKGDAHDSDIRHAVNQLRYALPSLVKRQIQHSLLFHPEDAIPHFILPLIITSAPLHVLNCSLSIEEVKAAESLEQISEKYNAIELHSESSDDFRKHCSRIFEDSNSETLESPVHNNLSKLIKYWASQNTYSSPIEDLEKFKYGEGPTGFFEEFIVCNVSHFEKLLSGAIFAIKNACQDSKKIISGNPNIP